MYLSGSCFPEKKIFFYEIILLLAKIFLWMIIIFPYQWIFFFLKNDSIASFYLHLFLSFSSRHHCTPMRNMPIVRRSKFRYFNVPTRFILSNPWSIHSHSENHRASAIRSRTQSERHSVVAPRHRCGIQFIYLARLFGYQCDGRRL